MVNPKKNLKRVLMGSLFSLLVLTTSACSSLLYKTTGDVLIGFAGDEAIPYLLTTDDPQMGCAMAESLGPLFFSFGTVTTPPDQLAILLYMMAGMCAETRAWEEELRYLRAVHSRQVIEAQDARIAQKRFMALAADRQYKGYVSLKKAYFEPGEKCPKFKNDNDELFWLVGLLNGMQAIFSDIGSEGVAGVPLDIAPKAARAAQCLDNEKWWGVPLAMQASIWTAIPGTKPKGEDPYKRLEQATEIGKRVGVRLTQVLELQIHLGQGHIDKAKDIIRDHAEAKKEYPSNEMLKVLDEVATMQVLAVSDRLWTEATGKRTPVGGLGTFWDDEKTETKALDLDSIL